MKIKSIKSIFFLIILSPVLSVAQCDLSGIADSYLLTDDPITLVGSPGVGTFSGVGVTACVFDPVAAGPGVHLIYYTVPESGTGHKYLIQSALGDPWGMPVNQANMNLAFGGASEWIYAEFETLDFDAIFADSTGLVFMDGSSMGASALNTFLIDHILEIQEWVNNGGRLYLNSAPNEGGDLNFGFGGTTLSYDPDFSTYSTNVELSDVMHPAVFGPNSPTVLTMMGTYFGHGLIEGSGYHALLVDVAAPSRILLAEKNWGEGRVMVGGLTTSNFDSPLEESTNWRANILYHMYNDVCAKLITVEGSVGIEEDNVDQLMYPNPTGNFRLAANTSVEVFTMSGQQVIAPILNTSSMDVSNLSAGMYLVVFTNEFGVSSKKLIIN